MMSRNNPATLRAYYERNKEKCDAQAKAWAKANPEKRKEIQRKSDLKRRDKVYARLKENKLKAILYKGGKCTDCGGVFIPEVFDFHHLNPSEKELKPSWLRYYTWEKAAKELDKCILLCANCHRIRHATDRGFNKS